MEITIPGYKVKRLLGSGGMGMVYLAEDKFGREVAIKVLLENMSIDDNIRMRFFNEAKLMARLSHPAITVIHDFIEFGDRLALVMEYVEGRTLDTMIGHEIGPIPYERALPLFRQILEGVGHAHERGVIHRDLKPTNIIVTSQNRVKITDFGIAKIVGEKGLTRTGVRVGTLLYMSPEQIMGNEIDHRTDIYSLGITLYEMLAGRLPFDEKSTSEFEVMEAILRKELPDPRSFYPEIPDSIISVLNMTLEKNPSNRIQSCTSLASLLTDEMDSKSHFKSDHHLVSSEKPTSCIESSSADLVYPNLDALADGMIAFLSPAYDHPIVTVFPGMEARERDIYALFDIVANIAESYSAIVVGDDRVCKELNTRIEQRTGHNIDDVTSVTLLALRFRARAIKLWERMLLEQIVPKRTIGLPERSAIRATYMLIAVIALQRYSQKSIKKYAKALPYLLQLCKEFPKSPLVHTWAVDVLTSLERYQEAREFAYQAVALSLPDDPPDDQLLRHIMLAFMYISNGELDKAEKSIKEASIVDNTSTESRTYIALCEEKLHRARMLFESIH